MNHIHPESLYICEQWSNVKYMRALVREKGEAILLRKQGHSYREILNQLDVSKSSLSEWLRDLPLTRVEKHALKERRDGNITRGRMRAASELHRRRLEREHQIFQDSKIEFVEFSKDSLFLIGVALYWAEGSKRSSGFSFINSDTDMIVLMVRWIERFFKIPPTGVRARLYIHKPYAQERLEQYWSIHTGLPLQNFLKTIYKPTTLLIKKRPNYKGCLRLELGKRSQILKMLFWKDMIIEQYRIK